MFLDAVGPASQESGRMRIVAVRFEPGTGVEAATEQFAKTMGGTASEVTTSEVPEEVLNLRNVRRLPVVLAVFLALLALAALLHVLATSARVRSRDFAILRSIGMTKRGTRFVLNAQGTAIAVVGLVVGVPLGVLAGRFAWSEVADSVPLENVSPFAVLAIALLVPAVAVIANLIALVPGQRATRVRPAEALRTE
jgi:ABC-type lipoprotein release transport system permease subunit